MAVVQHGAFFSFNTRQLVTQIPITNVLVSSPTFWTFEAEEEYQVCWLNTGDLEVSAVIGTLPWVCCCGHKIINNIQMNY